MNRVYATVLVVSFLLSCVGNTLLWNTESSFVSRATEAFPIHPLVGLSIGVLGLAIAWIAVSVTKRIFSASAFLGHQPFWLIVAFVGLGQGVGALACSLMLGEPQCAIQGIISLFIFLGVYLAIVKPPKFASGESV